VADQRLYALVFEADKAHDAVVAALARLATSPGTGSLPKRQADVMAAGQRWEAAMVALYAAAGVRREMRL
jgi:hypothetical protein